MALLCAAFLMYFTITNLLFAEAKVFMVLMEEEPTLSLKTKQNYHRCDCKFVFFLLRIQSFVRLLKITCLCVGVTKTLLCTKRKSVVATPFSWILTYKKDHIPNSTVIPICSMDLLSMLLLKRYIQQGDFALVYHGNNFKNL